MQLDRLFLFQPHVYLIEMRGPKRDYPFLINDVLTVWRELNGIVDDNWIGGRIENLDSRVRRAKQQLPPRDADFRKRGDGDTVFADERMGVELAKWLSWRKLPPEADFTIEGE